VLIDIPATEQAAGVRWATVKIPGGEFEVGIRPPTFDEQVADLERFGQQLPRLKRHVVDWRGLERRVVDTTNPDAHVETSQPWPFSWEDFRRLCGRHPGVLTQVAAEVGRVFRGLGEAEAGN
jgi:hypothetical protein